MKQILKKEKSVFIFCLMYIGWLTAFRYLFIDTISQSLFILFGISLISYLPILLLAFTCYRKEMKQWLNLQMLWPPIIGLIVYIAVSIFIYFLLASDLTIDSASFIYTVVEYLLMTGVWEEIMYRGIVYTTFKTKRGKGFAGLMSCILFTAAHLPVLMSGHTNDIFGFVVLSIIISVIFICLFERTHSLWLAIFCHALWDLNNAIAFPLFIYLAVVMLIEQLIKYRKRKKTMKKTKVSSSYEES